MMKMKTMTIMSIYMHTFGSTSWIPTAKVLAILCHSPHLFSTFPCPFSFLLVLVEVGDSNRDQKLRGGEKADI